MNQGWSCPGCGRCYSPTTPQCFTCGQPVYTKQQTNTGGLFSNQTGKFEPPQVGCKYPGMCVSKDGYCAKCHSEYY